MRMLGRLATGWMFLSLVGLGWATEEELVIAARPVAAPASDPLTSSIRVLGGDAARQDERSEALRVIAKATDPAGDKVVNHLDAQKHDDWVVRRGAVRGLQALGISGPRVSSALAWTVTRDGEPKVREEAISVIKTRGDRTATDLIGRHLLESFNDQGIAIQAQVIDLAVGALRSIGDRRVAEGMCAYVVAETQAAATTFNGMRSRQMRAVVPRGEGVNESINLPIEFPEIGVTKYRGTVLVPASSAALRSLTGQDFGTNAGQWQRWIRSHPASDWK